MITCIAAATLNYCIIDIIWKVIIICDDLNILCTS